MDDPGCKLLLCYFGSPQAGVVVFVWSFLSVLKWVSHDEQLIVKEYPIPMRETLDIGIVPVTSLSLLQRV